MIAAIVTVAVAALVGSAIDVTVTVTVGGTGTVAGTVYFPVASIVPQLAPVQPVPETLQVTAWLAVVGLTLAVNCCAPLGWTVTLDGVTVTVATAAVGGGFEVAFEVVPPPHPAVPDVTRATIVAISGEAFIFDSPLL